MFKIAVRQLSAVRRYSTATKIDSEALDKWISSPSHEVAFEDSFRSEHLSNLYITLPTRDGTRKPYQEPKDGSPLGYGHHLVFFHSRVPESQLRENGTEPGFSPPKPFSRRMWAGGKITWDPENPLIIGNKATARSTFASIEKKGFEDPQKDPMLVVTQKIDITMKGMQKPSVTEERSHVYLSTADTKKAAREVRGIPTSSDFSFEYKPSLTTLFRFSALIFNGHHIHLDQEFAQKQGYPERLVHGPLTAMMLLETAVFHNPNIRISSFEYRARNPMIVNRTSTIHGTWTDKDTIDLWCVEEGGLVGMTGKVHVG
ncbi:Mesaconyl-C(4)-CoA hydratase [Hypsizygus marmoreus]|uniref:Mesaconyl-C(4)-CoA hydratase n=1 Tax=Hypsizygus marmoreus TaxID=39966 RepID=A0A369JEE2_HYPMA|nr:Mesaconyl-C(4)-CoA hydratase [Hypsizygus marmoreus]